MSDLGWSNRTRWIVWIVTIVLSAIIAGVVLYVYNRYGIAL